MGLSGAKRSAVRMPASMPLRSPIDHQDRSAREELLQANSFWPWLSQGGDLRGELVEHPVCGLEGRLRHGLHEGPDELVAGEPSIVRVVVVREPTDGVGLLPCRTR